MRGGFERLPAARAAGRELPGVVLDVHLLDALRGPVPPPLLPIISPGEQAGEGCADNHAEQWQDILDQVRGGGFHGGIIPP